MSALRKDCETHFQTRLLILLGAIFLLPLLPGRFGPREWLLSLELLVITIMSQDINGGLQKPKFLRYPSTLRSSNIKFTIGIGGLVVPEIKDLPHIRTTSRTHPRYGASSRIS